MSDVRGKFDEELDLLRTMRDELRVQLHLGAAEVKEKWEKVEHSWENVELEVDKLRSATEEAAEDIGSAAKLLLDEIREGYKHLKDQI